VEKQGNPSIMELTVKAGETIILKGEDGATISEVKKPKRNIQKEREWEQSKYHRFTFLVDKPQAQRFMDLLPDGKRPLDWFREQVSSYIDNTLNVKTDNTLNDNNNALNENSAQDIDTLNDIDSTLNVINNTFNVESNLKEKPKRTVKPPPKQEEKEQWETEYNNGLPAKRIAEMFGRDVRAVKKHLEQAGILS